MEKAAYTERLARLVFTSIIVVLVALMCKYFMSVLVYIVLALVCSLISRPILRLLRKVKIKGKSAPDWLLAILIIIILLGLFSAVISGLVPVFTSVVREIMAASNSSSFNGVSGPLQNINDFIIGTFALDSSFKVEALVVEQLKNILNIGMFSSLIGSVASVVASLGVGLFSIIFISFFFIKDENLFTKIVLALTPDRIEQKASAALKDVDNLLSRYFVGLLIEMFSVGLVDFLGLWLIARLDFDTALGIGFLCGILNIVPYIGPLAGEVMGTTIGLIIKFCSAGAVGLSLGFWGFAAVLLAILFSAQLIDNFVLQPLIYSTSIKANPLEIFIVLLIAGHVGGIVGMLVAIPAYTVFRVIAGRFFGHVKFIAKLVPQEPTE